MLESLSIKNIALIEKQTVEFKKGLNVLSGETGAGKSLIIDSLSLLLGEKADKHLISKGQTQASVEAVFTSLNKQVKEKMEELGLDIEDQLIISRKISIEGKNECRVNGRSFTLSMLKKLAAPLMDLHGQFEHQNLLKISSHLNILDVYGFDRIKTTLNEYKKVYKELQEIQAELGGISTDQRERQRLIDLYTYQFEEIEQANFYNGEEEELKEFRNQVLHFEKITQSLDSACSLAKGDGYQYIGLSDSIKKIANIVSSVSGYNKELLDLTERLESLKIELVDIVDSLDNIKDNLYFDEEKAKINEQRLDLLSSFKKKYGSTINEINEFGDMVKKQCQELINAEEKIEKLVNKKQLLEQRLTDIAKELTKHRKEVSKDFVIEIEKELKDLGMKNSKFVVNFEALDFEKRTSNGFDKVEFMFSANLGQDVRPLKDVASGGEMSRFMLAVKNVTAKIENIGTLIFDEIDSGVSGHNAMIVAQKLLAVSKFSQVICVTHLPQIASFGNNHLLIEKFDVNQKTTTSVKVLARKERIQEVARLISGSLTNSSLTHAEELLDQAQEFNKNLK